MKNSRLRNLTGFIRLEFAIPGSLIGIIGYLIYNEPAMQMLFVFLSSFCVVSAAFAYNNLKDTEEDSLNNRQVSTLTAGRSGPLIIGTLFLAGFAFSLFLSLIAVALYMLMAALCFAYNFFRLKSSPLLKNLYSGFTWPIIFLMGAGSLGMEIIAGYILFSLYMTSLTMLADLRDYEGDKKSGVRTVPTTFGYEKARNAVFLILAGFPLVVFALNIPAFALFSIFSVIMILLLARNRPKTAHLSGATSIFLTTGLAFVI